MLNPTQIVLVVYCGSSVTFLRTHVLLSAKTLIFKDLVHPKLELSTFISTLASMASKHLSLHATGTCRPRRSSHERGWRLGGYSGYLGLKHDETPKQLCGLGNASRSSVSNVDRSKWFIFQYWVSNSFKALKSIIGFSCSHWGFGECCCTMRPNSPWVTTYNTYTHGTSVVTSLVHWNGYQEAMCKKQNVM